jgi:spore maturation protein CgeB
VKKILYIGQYSEGTTSKMRADILKKVSDCESFEVIDTHIPFFQSNKLWRSIGFKYKIGPLIWKTNKYISKNISNKYYDLVWVDKGVFINENLTKKIREISKKLVHFTPDMSFYENHSSHFIKNINKYDLIISTKTKEREFYIKHISEKKLYFCTQGFSKEIHKPWHSFKEKENAIVFIGLAENSRLEIAEFLLQFNFKLKIVGKGWNNFVEKYKNNKNLEFIGETIIGDEYSKLISSSYFALGLLSKRFPELHTTRTLEIPACKTALITEKNEEISSIYAENEVIFFQNINELPNKINFYSQNLEALKDLTENGYNKVQKNKYDYESIIRNLLLAIEK